MKQLHSQYRYVFFLVPMCHDASPARHFRRHDAMRFDILIVAISLSCRGINAVRDIIVGVTRTLAKMPSAS